MTTIPSFINELSRKVRIHKTIWSPIIFCIILYVILGILGAASFHIDTSSNILATISSTDNGVVLNVLSVVINVVFPVSVLVTSIPVFSIVVRYNLVRGNVCSKRNLTPCTPRGTWLTIRMGVVLGRFLPLDSCDTFPNWSILPCR